MKLLQAVLIALLMPLYAAHAALIPADSPLGSGSSVVDTNTGWEWLQLSATRELTIREALAATSPGGNLGDFDYATRTELKTLIDAYLWSGCTFACSTNEAAVEDFFGRFGISLKIEHGILTMLEPAYMDTSNPGIFGAIFILYTEPVPELYIDSQLVTLDERRLNETGPHWIVRKEQAIPEPSMGALLVLGAMAFAVTRRRCANG